MGKRRELVITVARKHRARDKFFILYSTRVLNKHGCFFAFSPRPRGTRLHNTYACKMAFNTPLKNTLKKATTNNSTKAYDVEKRIPERRERNTKEMKGGKEVRNKRKKKKKKKRKKEGRKERKNEKENKTKTNRRKREE